MKTPEINKDDERITILAHNKKLFDSVTFTIKEENIKKKISAKSKGIDLGIGEGNFNYWWIFEFKHKGLTYSLKCQGIPKYCHDYQLFVIDTPYNSYRILPEFFDIEEHYID